MRVARSFAILASAAAGAVVPLLQSEGDGPQSFPLSIRAGFGVLAALLILFGSFLLLKVRALSVRQSPISLFMKRGVVGYLSSGVSIPLAFLFDSVFILVIGFAVLALANVLFLFTRKSVAGDIDDAQAPFN